MRERKWQMEMQVINQKIFDTFYVSDTTLILVKVTFSLK